MAIRELTGADQDHLSAFTCARLGQAWAEAVQEVVRHDLVDQIATGGLSAIGLFDDDEVLVGVAAWRIYDATRPVLCRSDVVAVAVHRQRQGYGRILKGAVLMKAKTAGAVAVSSIVHRNNTAMLNLNGQFGAVVTGQEGNDDHHFCVIGPLM